MGLDIDRVRAWLPDRRILYSEVIGSTMDEAARLARTGCRGGAAVVADEQTHGRGRYGRAWHSERGAGLYVSVILRPRLSAESLRLLTLACGLAMRQAIEEVSGLDCDLRWPNDLLAGSKKCAGILVELEEDAAIVGAGVNVNHNSFHAELEGLATSLRLETGREHSREHLLVRFLECLDHYTDRLTREGRDVILAEFTSRSSYAQGRRVRVNLGGEQVQGCTDGLDPSGFLVLRKDDGTRTLILAGEVRPA